MNKNFLKFCCACDGFSTMSNNNEITLIWCVERINDITNCDLSHWFEFMVLQNLNVRCSVVSSCMITKPCWKNFMLVFFNLFL